MIPRLYISNHPSGWAQAVIDGPSGSRSSSARGYLAREFLLRPNLHVLVNAQVSRILQTGTDKGIPAFRQVEYRFNGQGERNQLKCFPFLFMKFHQVLSST